MSTLEGYMKNPIEGAYQTQCMLIEAAVRNSYREPPDDESYYVQNELHSLVLPQKPITAAIESGKIAKMYMRASEEATIGEFAMGSAALLIGGSLALAATPIAGVSAVIAAAGTNLVKNFMLEKHREETEKKVAIHVAEYVERNGDFSALLASRSEDETGMARYNELLERGHPVLDPEFDSIPVENRAIVQGGMLKILAKADEATFQALSDQGNRLKAQGVKIKDVEKKIVRINQRFSDFRVSTSSRLEDIEKNVSGINQGLEEVQKRVADNELAISQNANDIERNRKLATLNRGDVDYIQEFLYGKMEPEEQIAALKNGFFPEMSESERNNQTKKIKLAEQRKDLIESASFYMNGAQDLLGIASELDIEVPEEVSRVVTVGSTLMNAGFSIASGNYFGAIKSIASIAGLNDKKVDVGAERHNQVMTALGQLSQGQNQIIGNTEKLLNWTALASQQLDRVLQNQKVYFEAMVEFVDGKIQEVLEGQGKILKKLDSINTTLVNQHKSVMTTLSTIIHDIAMVRFSVRAEARADFNPCDTALDRMVIADGYVPSENRFQDYESIKRYYNRTRIHLDIGLPALTLKLPNAGNDSDMIFFDVPVLSGDISDDEKRATVTHYRKFMQFLMRAFKQDSEREGLLGSLLKPTHSVMNFTRKRSLPQNQRIPQRLEQVLHPLSGINPVGISRLLAELYNTDFVEEVSEYSYRFHYFFQYLEGGNNDFISFQQLQRTIGADEDLSLEGKHLLEAAMVRLDVAIAQQTLLTGDQALPKMLELFNEGRTEANHESYDTMIELCNENFMLAYNFMIYAFHQKASGKLMDYMFAMNEAGNSTRLRNLLGNQWKFHWKAPHKWFVEIGDRKGKIGIPLPDPVELKNGNFLISPKLQGLLDMRSKLAQEFASYDFPNKLTTLIEKERYIQAIAIRV